MCSMNTGRLFLVLLVLGSISEISGYQQWWGRLIGKTWENWRRERVHVKHCQIYEKYGLCPSSQSTVCILKHRDLVTSKLCDYCLEQEWFAYRLGTCPGDTLEKLAKETNNHYYRRHKHHNIVEEETGERILFNSGSGSGSGSGGIYNAFELTFNPIETQVVPNDEVGDGGEESVLVDLKFLERLPIDRDTEKLKSDQGFLKKLSDLIRRMRSAILP